MERTSLKITKQTKERLEQIKDWFKEYKQINKQSFDNIINYLINQWEEKGE